MHFADIFLPVPEGLLIGSRVVAIRSRNVVVKLWSTAKMLAKAKHKKYDLFVSNKNIEKEYSYAVESFFFCNGGIRLTLFGDSTHRLNLPNSSVVPVNFICN